MSITENVASIRARIDAAAIAAGREPKDILLCAATKMNDAEAVRQAVAAGVDCCGENRVQEAVEKFQQVRVQSPQAQLHIIGSLQRNKVKKALSCASCIQSVDRIELLEEIEKQAFNFQS